MSVLDGQRSLVEDSRTRWRTLLSVVIYMGILLWVKEHTSNNFLKLNVRLKIIEQ